MKEPASAQRMMVLIFSIFFVLVVVTLVAAMLGLMPRSGFVDPLNHSDC